MDERDLQRRAEIARRLKAARWLAGDIEPHDKGKVGWRVRALTTADLANRPQLHNNGITASLLGAIERMERPTPPMELQQIAEALGLTRDWLVAGDDPTRLDAMAQLQQLLADLGLAPDPSLGETPGSEDDQDHPDSAAGGGGG